MSASKVGSAQATALSTSDLSKKGSVEGKEKDNSSGDRGERSPSPEIAKCAICLGDVVNRSRSNSCVHSFCFGCLLEWSKVKPECPLCKSSFTTIYHNFRSNTEYDEYVVPTPIPHFSIRFTASATNSWLSPLIRVLRTSREQHQHSPLGHAYDGVAIPPGMVPHPPIPALMSMQTNPFNNGSSSRPEYYGDVVHDHRRTQEEALQIPGYQNRRRRYDRNEWVQPFGSTLQPGSVVFPSVEYVRTHPTAISRLRSWLYRELNVLLGLQRSRDQMAFVYDLIIHLLNHYDIRCRDFRDMVNSYFGTRTAHFQHEMYHFLLSGMSVEEYDRVADYSSPSSSSGSRRSTAPEVITLDSDDDNSSNSNITIDHISRPRGTDADIIILSESSDDDDDPMGLRPSRGLMNIIPSAPPRRNNNTPAAATHSDRDDRFSPMFRAPPTPTPVIEMPIPEPERPRRHTTNRMRAINVDPDMPVLEPEVFPYRPATAADRAESEPFSQFGRENRSASNTIDLTRATAAAIVSNASLASSAFERNFDRPSVLSRGSASSVAELPHFLGSAEIDLDLDVSVEAYASPPPRQDIRPLASPDFPILQLRRENLQSRAEELWTRHRPCPRSSVDLGGGSAFVPYDPEASNSRDQLNRPPRPSCIHERGSVRSVRPASSTSNSSASAGSNRASSPPFRVNLYPHGISSLQVMDLSRSAGLISSSSTRPSTTITHSTETAPPPVLTPASNSSSSHSLPVRLASPLQSTSSFRGFGDPHSIGVVAQFQTSLAAAAGALIPKPGDNKKETETNNDVSESEEDGLECLGSFPIQKKPPLAVITLSSDDEGEENNVKAERNETENHANLGSDDAFLMSWDPPSIETIEFLGGAESLSDPPTDSGRSNSSFFTLNHTQTSASTNSGSAEEASIFSRTRSGDSSMRLLLRRDNATDELFAPAEEQFPPLPGSSRTRSHKNSYSVISPKKKAKRLQIDSSSEDSDNDNAKSSRKSGNRSSSLGSSSAPAMTTPKKRKYVVLESSPSPPISPPHFTSSDSSESSDSNDEDYEVSYKSKRRKTSKKSSAKKKKSKSKKAKKSKKSKSKEKSKERRSRSKSGSSKTDKDTSASSTAGSSGSGSKDVGSLKSSSVESGSGGSVSRTRGRSKKSRQPSSSSSTQPNTTRSSTLTLQPISSSSSSSSLGAVLPPCSEIDYQSNSNDLLDLSFNPRADALEDHLEHFRQSRNDNGLNRLLEPINLRALSPSIMNSVSTLASTVDVSALFDSMENTYNLDSAFLG